MKTIYLDHAATSPLEKAVAAEMQNFALKFFGNPNSTHIKGQEARAEIDFARDKVAKFLNCKSQEIIFTSGATEANNLAIQGIVSYYIKEFQIKPHVISTKLEHQSVYNTIKELQKRGVIEASFINPTPDGLIDPKEVIRAITESTVLISTIFVSNEIGSILPVREIGKLLSEVNMRQKMRIMYHIDAVQATKYLNCNVDKLHCDLLTISAHKIYGPKGIGTLFIKSGTKIANLMFGGAQEYGLRPGTQNTAGIIGMVRALELLGTLEDRQKVGNKISKLRDELIRSMQKIPNAILNGPIGEDRVADNVNFTIFDIDQDVFMASLDLA
ncbi:MAG TPA: cysteine desulfurase family protein, partial [Methylomirabilota bacterium]|nr:cysteine desulfurase family protein [Methylomirabilota bacterium]